MTMFFDGNGRSPISYISGRFNQESLGVRVKLWWELLKAHVFLTETWSEPAKCYKTGELNGFLSTTGTGSVGNSTSVIGTGIYGGSMDRILERAAGKGPRYLVPSGQKGVAKLFRFASKL